MAHTIVNHDLRSNDGVTVWLPPHIQDGSLVNLSPPEIRTHGTDKKYPIGTKVTTDERVFRYCLADTAGVVRADYGAGNNNPQTEGDAIGNAVAGSYILDWRISDKDNPGSIAYNTKNIYEGGYIWIMNADVELWEFHKIVKNDAATGTDTSLSYVRLTLAEPITTPSSAPWCTAYKNIYSDVRQEYPSYPSANQYVVCVPHIKALVDEYFWGQTWGPMWTTTTGVAPAAPNRTMCFYPGGVIARMPGDVDPTAYGYQVAGYIFTDTTYAGDMGYMMMICP